MQMQRYFTVTTIVKTRPTAVFFPINCYSISNTQTRDKICLDSLELITMRFGFGASTKKNCLSRIDNDTDFCFCY